MASTKKNKGVVRAREYTPARFRGELTPGDAVRVAREMLGWSQRELGIKAGLLQAHISSIESGRIVLGLERAKRIAVAMNLHPSVLLFCNWDEEKTKIAKAS